MLPVFLPTEFPSGALLGRKRQWHPTPVLLPGKSHGRRSLVDCSPLGHEESDTIERLHFHFSLSCVGEGNGTPLQCSCLENPRDGEPGGVTQSQTLLKRLSSSSTDDNTNAADQRTTLWVNTVLKKLVHTCTKMHINKIFTAAVFLTLKWKQISSKGMVK